jgi:hypothetical protein
LHFTHALLIVLVFRSALHQTQPGLNHARAVIAISQYYILIHDSCCTARVLEFRVTSKIEANYLVGDPGMPTCGRCSRRWGQRRLGFGFVFAVAGLGLMAGCGGGDSSKPAPVDQAQMKKAQAYLGNYREQMIAANKAQAQAKAKAKQAEKNPQ